MAAQVNAEQASEPTRFEPKAVVPVAVPPRTEPPSSVENTPLLTADDVKGLGLVVIGADGLALMAVGAVVFGRMVQQGRRRMSPKVGRRVCEAMMEAFRPNVDQASEAVIGQETNAG